MVLESVYLWALNVFFTNDVTFRNGYLWNIKVKYIQYLEKVIGLKFDGLAIACKCLRSRHVHDVKKVIVIIICPWILLSSPPKK